MHFDTSCEHSHCAYHACSEVKTVVKEMINSGNTNQVRGGTVVGSYGGDDDKVREAQLIINLDCADENLTSCSSPELSSLY